MQSVRFELARNTAPIIYLPVQMCPALERRVLPRVVQGLRDQRPTDLISLLVDDFTADAREFFSRARDEESPYVLPRALVFPEEFYPMCFEIPRLDAPGDDDVFALEIMDEADLRALAPVMSGEWQDAHRDDTAHRLGCEFVEHGLLRPVVPDRERRIDFDRPGIFRLQHASLLFRSESSAVIADPQFSYATSHSWLHSGEYPNIDAVLISHSHADHFCLASLLRFPKNTAIVVPRVERASLLSPPMAEILRAAGFTNVIDAEWFSEHVFGDIRVTVYPFYGEQPWLTFASPDPHLRNWGNTYLVEANGVKTWFLIDSGQEFGRSMLDLCGRVRQEHGHIDVVMSNLREFTWSPSQIDGSGRYLYCFPTEIVLDPQRW
ncbi:MBL fold metallo-hydrolase, partial [Nannocystis radixulma]